MATQVVFQKKTNKALTLSLVPGLGHVYVQNKKKGMLLFGAFLLMFILKSKLPLQQFILVEGIVVGYSMYDCYNIAVKTAKNERVKKDPYYALCLSLIYDGWGQFYVKQNMKGIIMASTGLTPCIITWVGFVMKFSLNGLLSAEGVMFMVTNFLIVWLIAAVPIKVISLIDAFYTVYHLYVQKKQASGR